MGTDLSDRIPVTDGDKGADIYGLAANAEQAVALAKEMFVDEVSHAERRRNVVLRTGERLPEAWVVITISCAEQEALSEA